MSLTVTQRPFQVYLSNNANWNAVKNPIVYKMTRKDFTYNLASNSGGFMRLQFTGVNIASSFVIGNSVYTSTGGVGTVTASAFSGGNTLVTLSIAYSSAATGYVNNLSTRPLYVVEVEVYDSLFNLLNASPFRYVANSIGNVLIDVSTIIKAALTADFSGDLTTGADYYQDTDVYRKFYIKYREVWTGSANAQTDDYANQFFAVLGALQIPSALGGNMGIYTVEPIKFLSKLERFVMWRGYPSLLTAIISDNITPDVSLESDTQLLAPTDLTSKVITFDLNQLIVDQTPTEIEVKLVIDGVGDLSEELTVELRDPCENPILLQGRNSLGGVLQWLFDENQEYTFDYGNGIKAKRMRLFADDLTLNQWEALQDFFTLGEVYKNNIQEFTADTIKTATRTDNQVYVIDTDGNKIGVIVVPRTPSTETKQVKHIFEIEIEYPEQFA